jgi:group II intron reverse transcriptase/maturase
VLNAVYEVDFLGFSYGFRPGRSQHEALDALTVGLRKRKVNWVLDADLRGFFDTLRHEWLEKFVEHRIGDRRIVRLLQKWWSAGVLEDGKRTRSEVGTVQGGSISPLLANLYLHHVLDLWVQWWRKKQAQGDVIIVRWADDFVMGFEHREEAERFWTERKERFAKFGLELHPEKTRLIEFGRNAVRARAQRGEGKPETFNFLGFTHLCSRTRKGSFQVLRTTMRKRWQAKLREVHDELRQRINDPIPEQGAYLRAVVAGHTQYFGVPGNHRAIYAFRGTVEWLWRQVLRRRSHKRRITWERVKRLSARWLPPARVCHPWPEQRLGVTT